MLIEQKEMSGYPRFTELCSIFLHPGNRRFKNEFSDPLNASQLEELAAFGITRVFHGHTNDSGGETYKYKDLIEFVNVDYGTGLPGEDPDLRSTAYLDRENKLHLGRAESEQIGQYNLMARELNYWLGEIFANYNLDFEPMTKPLMGLLQLKTSEDLDDVLFKNTKLQSFLQILATSAYLPGKECLQPRIDQIYEMINFYYDFLHADSRPLIEMIEEMESYKIGLMDIPEEWQKRHTAAPAATSPVSVVQPAPTTTTLTPPAASTPAPPAAQPTAVTKPHAPLIILSKDQADQTDFEELEKTALENLGDLLGADAYTTSMIVHFLSELKLTDNKRYRSFIKLINQYPDVLGFLFTLKYAGQ
jgi:hypothetical protein